MRTNDSGLLFQNPICDNHTHPTSYISPNTVNACLFWTFSQNYDAVARGPNDFYSMALVGLKSGKSKFLIIKSVSENPQIKIFVKWRTGNVGSGPPKRMKVFLLERKEYLFYIKIGCKILESLIERKWNNESSININLVESHSVLNYFNSRPVCYFNLSFSLL